MAKQIGNIRIGGEKRWKIITAGVLGAFALFMVVRMAIAIFGGPDGPPPAPAASRTAPTNSNGARHGNAATKEAAANGSKSLDPTLRFDLLARSENVEYTGAGRNVFSLTAPPPPIPQAIASIRPQDMTPPGPPPPPPKPPIQLTFYGYETAKGGSSKRIFLINPNEDVFIAGEGDIVDRRYKIMKISASSVDIRDILNDDTQTIRLSQQAG